jgi:uncharacterized protein DUF4386
MTTTTLHRAPDPTTEPLRAGPISLARPDIDSQLEDTPLENDRIAETNRSIRKASTAAGVGLLVMSVLSALGYLVAIKGLTVPGNAGATARNVAGHQGLFRFGLLSLGLVGALDVVVAWALCRVFRPVNEALSKLAGWLRIGYAAVFMVAISRLVRVLRLHAQALRRINTFTNVWDAGLVLFGLSLFVLAYLAYRSGYVPKLMGALLGIAGFGYVFDTVARALVRGSSLDVSTITGMGEFVFALWLVIRGRRITVSNSESHDNSSGAAR